MIKTTVVFFGDSNTKGYGLNAAQSAVDRFFDTMPVYYPAISWNIVNAGVSGDNTADALGRVDGDVLLQNPNVVFIMFGTNDIALQTSQYVSSGDYEGNLDKIVQKILKHNNRTGLNDCKPIPVFITSPAVIDQKAAPERTDNRIRQYNYIVKSVVDRYGCPYIDFYSEMVQSPEFEQLLQPDGYHLSAAGHALLYDLIFSEFSKLITYEGILRDFPLKG